MRTWVKAVATAVSTPRDWTDDTTQVEGHRASPHRFGSTVEAKPLQALVAFPVEVEGESFARYRTVAKRAMRGWVDEQLRRTPCATDEEAIVALMPIAVDDAGRDLKRDEVALLAFTIFEYTREQDAQSLHRPGRIFG